MGQKIIKIGSSLGVTLSRSVLEDAGLKHGDELTIRFSSKDGTIIIVPAELEAHYKDIAAIRSIAIKYRAELAKLDD